MGLTLALQEPVILKVPQLEFSVCHCFSNYCPCIPSKWFICGIWLPIQTSLASTSHWQGWKMSKGWRIRSSNLWVEMSRGFQFFNFCFILFPFLEAGGQWVELKQPYVRNEPVSLTKWLGVVYSKVVVISTCKKEKEVPGVRRSSFSIVIMVCILLRGSRNCID